MITKYDFNKAFEIYEYAGFKYNIDTRGDFVIAIPQPGQHAASKKEKHRQAAVECWKADQLVKKVYA